MNLLLLRGLIRDQRSWGEFPQRFEAHAPRMKLHFLDLPGVGTEYRRPSPTSIPAIRIEVAKRFHDLIARGKLPAGPWSLIAMSMGGMIALDWAEAEPKLFQKMVLLNTSSVDVAGPLDRFRPAMLPVALLSLLSNHPETSEKRILRIASTRFARDPTYRDPKLRSVYEDLVKSRRERPVTRTTFIRQLLSAARYRIPENRPVPKTMVVSSDGDRIVNPRCSALLADRLGAARLTHPWAGHDIPIDDPEWLARELSEWMESRA